MTVCKLISRYSLPLLVVALLVIAVLVILLVESRSELRTYRDNETQFDNLFYGQSQGVKGQACVLLTENVAVELLQQPVEQNDTSSRQGAAGYGSQHDAENGLYWSDSCSYVSQADSGKYVELFINTYQSTEMASEALEQFLPVVNRVESLTPPSDFEKHLYDAGVHYLLRGKEVVRVAASNGNPAENKDFSYQVLQYILSSL